MKTDNKMGTWCSHIFKFLIGGGNRSDSAGFADAAPFETFSLAAH